jgi:hypothetical protein
MKQSLGSSPSRVVLCPLAWCPQDLVRVDDVSGSLLECILVVPRITTVVRVPFHQLTAERSLDVLCRSCSRHPENRIRIIHIHVRKRTSPRGGRPEGLCTLLLLLLLLLLLPSW